jgi:hypothetical protein
MSDDFDLLRLDEIRDPLAGVGDVPLPPLRSRPLARPRTRSQLAAQRLAALGMALAYQVAWLAILKWRGDLHSTRQAALFLEVSVPLFAAAVALGAAVTPGRHGLGMPKGRLAMLTLLAPVVFALVTLVGAPADMDVEPFFWHALRCFGFTLLFAAGPLALVAWAYRHAFVAAPGWRVAALGIASGGLAAATMSMVCSVGNAGHVLVGHGGMILVGGLVGALFGPRFGRA